MNEYRRGQNFFFVSILSSYVLLNCVLYIHTSFYTNSLKAKMLILIFCVCKFIVSKRRTFFGWWTKKIVFFPVPYKEDLWSEWLFCDLRGSSYFHILLDPTLVPSRWSEIVMVLWWLHLSMVNHCQLGLPLVSLTGSLRPVFNQFQIAINHIFKQTQRRAKTVGNSPNICMNETSGLKSLSYAMKNLYFIHFLCHCLVNIKTQVVMYKWSLKFDCCA